MGVLYERDLIAERDSRDKLHSSIVKWWQVKYNEKKAPLGDGAEEIDTSDAIEATNVSEALDEDLKLAEEVFARLSAEKAADDAVLQAQIDQAYAEAAAAEAARLAGEDYNSTTGSYSGAYGKNNNLDESGLSQVDSIMGEKDAALRALISSAQN